MSTATLTTSVEKIQPTAIIKLDGPLNDFHAKELIGIIDDLLPQNFVHFIINFDKCAYLEKKLKMMGLAAYAEFYSEDKVALESLIQKL